MVVWRMDRIINEPPLLTQTGGGGPLYRFPDSNRMELDCQLFLWICFSKRLTLKGSCCDVHSTTFSCEWILWRLWILQTIRPSILQIYPLPILQMILHFHQLLQVMIDQFFWILLDEPVVFFCVSHILCISIYSNFEVFASSRIANQLFSKKKVKIWEPNRTEILLPSGDFTPTSLSQGCLFEFELYYIWDSCGMVLICESCDYAGSESFVGSMTFDECKRACFADSTCFGIDYGKNDRSGECFLNSAPTSDTTSHGNFDAYRKECGNHSKFPTSIINFSQHKTYSTPMFISPGSHAIHE